MLFTKKNFSNAKKPGNGSNPAFKKLIVIDITKENTIKSEFVREEKDLVEFMPCLEALPRFRRTAAAATTARAAGAALPPRDCDAHQQSVYTRARSSSANRMQFEITPLTMSAGRSPTHPSSQARRSPPPWRAALGLCSLGYTQQNCTVMEASSSIPVTVVVINKYN